MEVIFNKKRSQYPVWPLKNPGNHNISLIKGAEPHNPPPLYVSV